jgi:ketosteroid isomerase-like protein
MFVRLLVLISLLLISVAACAPAQPSSKLGARPTTPAQADAAPARTPTPQPASDEEAIRQLIVSEGRGVVSQDIAGLMDLWAADAVITDAKHTPENPDDDARWNGRDAIRERYVVLVFPGNPTAAGAADIELDIQGDRASAVSTTAIGSEVAPGGDRWTFQRADGRWWITGLTYNLEAK